MTSSPTDPLITTIHEACSKASCEAQCGQVQRDHILKFVPDIIKEALKGRKYRYAALHYRSVYLSEGRDSPADLNCDEVWDALACIADDECGLDESQHKPALEKIIRSIVRTYLYIFGRDISFSENYILRQQQKERKPRDTTTNTGSWVQLKFSSDDEGLSGKSSESSGGVLCIPPKYYKALTYDESLVRRFIREVLEQTLQTEGDPLLSCTADYRRVLLRLEQESEEGTAFSDIRQRGLEVALYYLSQDLSQGDEKAIVEAYDTFKRDVASNSLGDDSRSEEQHRRYFLRVVQAASIFKELLGDTLTVFPFPGIRSLDESLAGELQGHIGCCDSVEQLKATLQGYLALRSDLWSGLTVYSSSKPEEMREDVERAIAGICALTASVPLSRDQVAPTPSDQKPANSIQRFCRETLSSHYLDPQSLGGDPLAPQCMVNDLIENPQRMWPAFGVVCADCLRDVKHEGKVLGVSLAIGTDVEFRQVFTPLYEVQAENGQVATRASLHGWDLSNATDHREFSETLRNFARRNYAFLDRHDIFVCIRALGGARVEPCYVAQLLPEYHTSTFGETVNRVISTSGVTIARMSASGQGKVFARPAVSGTPEALETKKSTNRADRAELVYFCDPHHLWKRVGPRQEGDGDWRLEDLKQRLHELSSEGAWCSFVCNRLIPVIESIAEDAEEGGTIVIVKEAQAQPLLAQYFQLSEADLRLDLSAEHTIDLVPRDTLRRFVVQDGATIIDLRKRSIMPRIQLLALPPRRECSEIVNLKSQFPSQCYIRRKMAEWGTRHMSTLSFVMWARQKEVRKKVGTISAVVISADGEVHYLENNSDSDNVVRRVLMY